MEESTFEARRSVKLVGANGQISLGKGYAGRQVLVEEREPGVWLVRTAVVVPENEQWLHGPQAAASLAVALTWAAKTAVAESDVDALFDGMNHASSPAARSRSARSQQPRVSKKPAGT